MTTKQATTEKKDAPGLIPTVSIAASVSAQGATGGGDTVATPTEQPLTSNESASGPRPDSNDGLTPTNTKRQYIVKRCETCNWEFLAQRSWARFCSGNCRRQAWLKRNPGKAAELAEKDRQRLREHVIGCGGEWREKEY